MARRMAGAMTAGATTARVDRVMEVLVVKARAMADLVPMALRVADLVDREIAGPMGAAPAVSGAGLMVLLEVQGLVDLADLVVDLTVLAEEVEEVRAEGGSSNGWIRLIASSTKSCGRLSP